MTRYIINWESFLTFTFVISLIFTLADGLRGLITALELSVILLIAAAIVAYFDNKRTK